MKVGGEGHRECTAEMETRKLFSTLCYYCREKKEETLLNCTPCAPGSINYCLLCTAVSNQLCGSLDFALFGKMLPPPDGFFCNPSKENFILGSLPYFS